MHLMCGVAMLHLMTSSLHCWADAADEAKSRRKVNVREKSRLLFFKCDHIVCAPIFTSDLHVIFGVGSGRRTW